MNWARLVVIVVGAGVVSSLFLTCGVFAYVTARLGLHSVLGRRQTGCCGVADWPVAADPH